MRVYQRSDTDIPRRSNRPVHQHRRHKSRGRRRTGLLDVDSQVFQSWGVVSSCQEPSGTLKPIEAVSVRGTRLETGRTQCLSDIHLHRTVIQAEVAPYKRNTPDRSGYERAATYWANTNRRPVDNASRILPEVRLQLSAGRRPAQEIV
jgi:hypothetical protein